MIWRKISNFLWSRSRWTQNTPILPGRTSSEVFPDEKDDEAFNDAWEELTGEDPEDPDDRSQLLGWPYVI